MSEPKFTPGPWFVAETDDNEGYPETVIRGIDGIAGIAVAIDFSQIPGMREANARLIAAAPDLLEALRRSKFDSLNMSLKDLEFCRAAYAKALGAPQ